MRFPITSRTFSRRHHEKGKKSETLWQGSFQIILDPTSEILGEFPRRVQLGDSIGQNLGQKILAPANGIAELIQTTESSYFKISQDGNLEQKPEYQELIFDLNTFLNHIEKNAIYSLDFPGQSISRYLSSFNSTQDSELVLSPHANRSSPNYPNILQKEFAQEIESLSNLLQKIFPNKKIHNFLSPNSNKTIKKYSFPLSSPKYFLYDFMKKKVLGSNPEDEKKMFFMGGETIWHLIRALFYDIPFTKRHLSVECVDRYGRIDGKDRYFLISNGQNFRFLDKIFYKKYKNLSLNTVFEPARILRRDQDYYFNIFLDSNLILSVNQPKKNSELPCTECNDCNSFCPTQADPQKLLAKRGGFKLDQCIECGLCSFYCPSGIDFRSRIQEKFSTSTFILSTSKEKTLDKR